MIATMMVEMTGCAAQKPFQPPPHPAEQWHKPGYQFSGVVDELRGCGWILPADSVAIYGKINMNIYAEVEQCMQRKGFVYSGRTALICNQKTYTNLPACIHRSNVEDANIR